MIDGTLALPYEPYFKIGAPSETRWKALKVYQLYRLVISMVILGAYFFGISIFENPFRFPDVFLGLAISYCVIAFLLCGLGWTAKMKFSSLIIIEGFVDCIILTAMIFTSLGVQSGMGILLNVSIAALSILLPGMIALFFASLTTFLLIVQHGFAILLNFNPVASAFVVGLHGVGLFLTAITALMLAKRVEQTEIYAAKQKETSDSLVSLNETIVAHMHAGIIALDGEWRVRLMNQAAYSWLGLAGNISMVSVREIAPELSERLKTWTENQTAKLEPIRPRRNGPAISLDFTTIGKNETQTILVIMEDMSKLNQHAQQLKLASLGRFTASIAHELRNPLGAIAHAVQLLLEEIQPESPQHRLADIIHTQTERMNQVIKNILQLSRQKPAVLESIALKPWIDTFVKNYQKSNQPTMLMNVTVSGDAVTAKFDPEQLDQVLSILCDNALHHAKPTTGELIVSIHVYYDPILCRSVMEVKDNGQGIPPDIAQHVFEPFYTTSRTGTGLGLYIANEVCTYNQATLTYQSRGDGACFRIEFY